MRGVRQQQHGECGRSDLTRDRLAEYVAELAELERQLTGEMIARRSSWL